MTKEELGQLILSSEQQFYIMLMQHEKGRYQVYTGEGAVGKGVYGCCVYRKIDTHLTMLLFSVRLENEKEVD